MIDEIPHPGTCMIEGMPATTYHKIKAVSATSLKTMAQSCRHEFIRSTTPIEPTPAMILGTATHIATLEPEKLDTTILVAWKCEGFKADRSACTNNGKLLCGGRWYCGVHAKRFTPDPLPTLLDEDENLVTAPVLSPDDFEKAKAMARSVRRDKNARAMLESPTAKTEVSFFWVEKVTIDIDDKPETFEVPCKMRADLYDPAFSMWGPTISDIKSCQCSDRPDFEGDIADRRYDIQAAWYLDGASKALGGVAHEHFVFFAIESTAAHIAAVYKAEASLIDHGRMAYQEMLAMHTYCKAVNYWPGYSDNQIRKVSIGGYKFRQLERERKRVD